MNLRPEKLLRVWFGVVVVMGLALAPARGQTPTARLSGFVTDQTSSEALELVNVVLIQDTVFVTGTITDRDGLYVIPRIVPGRYVLQISFVGYATHTDTLNLASGQVLTINVALQTDEASLDEVVVQTERTSGAARITAGQQVIRPEDVQRIPTTDVTGDLVGYLNTLPGVVSPGDRGGQLFIRGGEPSQNLVLIDGILLYQPFHILGFYSAFPADILSRTDFYAGGFSSKFGGRISSVLDVSTRNGNQRAFSGSASLSPFISSARVEGPIIPDRISFLASARQSTLEQGAARYIDAPLPFHFGDVFAKLHADVSSRSRFSVTALQTYDRGTLDGTGSTTALNELRWRNEAIGLRWLMLPRILPVVADFHLSHSRFKTELGPSDIPQRQSGIRSTYGGLDVTFFRRRATANAGFSVRLTSIESALDGVFQNVELKAVRMDQVAQYLQFEFKNDFGLLVQPGVRLQFYQTQTDPKLEPRLRMVWERGIHQFSGATGLYYQEIVGLSDRRDAASVFTIWTNIPRSGRGVRDIRAGRLPRALHAILGYQATPTSWLDVSVEGFYKWLDNLFVPEWTAFPRLTTRLQPASGRSGGFDARLELRRPSFYLTFNYGLSSTRYRAEQEAIALWYGTETYDYRPPHDRRHQFNALMSLSRFGFDVNVRWQFGSGLPFSRAFGFDRFILVDDLIDVAEIPGAERVIYERPFNGVLPTYHRLDVSIDRTFRLGIGALTLQASLINAYDRRNLFYLDVFTLEQVDQLPFVPSFGLKVDFN